jgi:hypothetical protein
MELMKGAALLKTNVSMETRQATRAGIESEAYYTGKGFLKG